VTSHMVALYITINGRWAVWSVHVRVTKLHLSYNISDRGDKRETWTIKIVCDELKYERERHGLPMSTGVQQASVKPSGWIIILQLYFLWCLLPRTYTEEQTIGKAPGANSWQRPSAGWAWLSFVPNTLSHLARILARVVATTRYIRAGVNLLTLCTPSLTPRSPIHHHGHLNCVIG